MKFITVFTPAYNRAYCLHRLYESLLKQKNQHFVWLIVDDGSTDNTKALAQQWMDEQRLDIRYIYKANGGMHTAHNAAYKNIDTELNVCIDSDDFMPVDAIESIYQSWQKIKGDGSIAGLIGLDESIDGKLIGTEFNEEYKPTTLEEFYYKQNGRGDKKLVLRSELTRAYPGYPEYAEERLVPLDTLYVLICRDYKLMPINQVWCTVDYQPDGSSATIVSQYFKSPKGFRYAREVHMKYSSLLKVKVRNAIHYNISTLVVGDKSKVFASPLPLLTVLFFPLSFLVFLFLKLKRG